MFYVSSFYLLGFWLMSFYLTYSWEKFQQKRILSFFLAITLLFLYYFKMQPLFRFATSFPLKDEAPQLTQFIIKNTTANEKIFQINIGSSVYYLSQRQPINKFIFYYPWVDWVPKFKQAVKKDLKAGKPKLIVVNQKAAVDSQKSYPQSYQEIIDIIGKNYSPIKTFKPKIIVLTRNY